MLSCALALRADTDDSQQVLSDLKPVLRGHRVLYRFELRGVKLNDLATLRTDHVIVMLMFVIVFVVRASVTEADFACESGVSQDFQGAIDSGLTDGRIFFLHQLVEIFIREMVFSAEKNVENQLALRRAFQSLFLDVFKEDFLLF